METFRERTLANRYQPRQHLPPEFPRVLKEYAREVLREQPDDILQWSANYFKRLACEMDSKQLECDGPVPSALQYQEAQVSGDQDGVDQTTWKQDATLEQECDETLQSYIDTFAELDSDNTGVLPLSHIREVILKSYDVTLPQLLYILTSTDQVEKDMVNYTEFACESLPALRFVQKTGHNFEVDNAEDATVHGLSALDVQQEFLKLFRFADHTDTALLSVDQYMDVLRSAPYHLTKRDLRLLLVEAEFDEKCNINYEEELVKMFDRLLLAEQFSLIDKDE